MDKKTLYFWLIFIVSVAISAAIISVFLKAVEMVLLVILALALAPVVFFILKKLLLPGKKDGSEKLKTRN